MNRHNDVEYALISSNSQYIDTGIISSGNLTIEISFKKTLDITGYDSIIYGGRSASGTSVRMLYIARNNQSLNTKYQSGTALPLGSTALEKGVFHNIVDSPQSVQVNGITHINRNPINFTANSTICLFTTKTNNVVDLGQMFSGQIKSCVIKNDLGETLRDFIAVPQGSTRHSSIPAPSNCMFDRVSNAYFENNGTGTFGVVEISD